MVKSLSCESCFLKGCEDDSDYPDFCITKKIDGVTLDHAMDIYKDNELVNKIMKISSKIEYENYLKATRIEETIKFIKQMGFKKVGIATCISFLPEIRKLSKVFDLHEIEHIVISCKVGSVDKEKIGVENKYKFDKQGHESMCNPILQASFLESEGTDFNIVFGLCVGHDSLFYMHTNTPTTTMVVKDRVTCHNPIAPLHYLDGIYSRITKK